MKKLMLLLMVVFLVGTISALEIDNRLNYLNGENGNEDLKVKFEDTFLWLFPLGEIGTAELKSHKEVNEVKEVGIGKQVVMFYDFNFNGDYPQGLGEVTFTDPITGEITNEDYQYVYWFEDEYEHPLYDEDYFENGTAFSIQVGTETRTRGRWLPYETTDIPAKKIRIGIEVDVKEGDYRDGVWEIVGKKVKRHAEWIASLETDILTWVGFNETSGSTAFDLTGNISWTYQGDLPRAVDGINPPVTNFSQFFDGAGDFINTSELTGSGGDYSFSFWTNISDSGGGSNDYAFESSAGRLIITFGNSDTSENIGFFDGVWRNLTVPASTDGEFRHYVFVFDSGNSNALLYINATNVANATYTSTTFSGNIGIGASNGGGNFIKGKLEEYGIWERLLSFAEVTILYNDNLGCTWQVCEEVARPSITLNSPVDNFNSTIQSVTLNATVTDVVEVTNVTFFVDGIINITNSSGFNGTYILTQDYSDGTHNWRVLAFNSINKSTQSATRTFTVNTMPVINVTSPLDNQNFTTSIIFFNATSSLSADTWIVNYNGTNTTLPGINTSLSVEDGTFNLLLYANNSITGVFGLNNSINFTVNTTPIINVFSPLDNQNFTTSTIFFNATSSLLIDKWIVNYNGTNTTLSNINTSLTVEDGSHQLLLYANNSVTGVFGLNNSINFSVDATLPVINLTSPIGDQGTFVSGLNLSLNWSVFDVNIDTCFYQYESSNTTVTCADNSTNLTVTNSTAITLIFWANDTFGNLNFDTTSWSYSFIEQNVSFEVNVSETSSQFFQLNLSTSLSILSISSILNYNGTQQVSTSSCDGSDCIISNTIDVPLVLNEEFELKDFFWEIDIFNGTDSISINTSTRQQNVSRIHLEVCDATFLVQSLNFTVFDEQTLDRIIPFTFDGTFDLWIGGGSIMRTSSITNSSNLQDMALCLSPNETIITDSIIDYDESTGTTYTNRFYYFDNKEINNVSEDIPMYLLNSSLSTSFILKVQDDSLLPVSNAIIEIQRYYPGTDEFRVVQIAKTDDSGKSIGFFQTETVDYRFIIKKDGETLLETNRQKIVPEVSPFTLTFTIGEPLGEPWASQEDLSNLNSSLNWDKTSGIITYIYIDSSNNFTSARLLVVKESLVNSSDDTTICNENLSLASGTLTCDVGTTNGFYVASSFITRTSTETLDLQFTFQIETLSGVVGLLGLFFGWFLVLIASFMFKFNEIAGIWAITITVFLINLMGLINFGGVFVTATIAIAIILTWIMER